MNTITIIISGLLLVSAVLLLVSDSLLTKSRRRIAELSYENAELSEANTELRRENAARRNNQARAAEIIKEMEAELADLKAQAQAQAPKAATIPDKVRVSNVIQSVTRYTGRSYADVAAELRQYRSEKIGRHWYYDRTQAEAIREIYKPKKSNK